MEFEDIIDLMFSNLSKTMDQQMRNPVISPYSILNALVVVRKSACGIIANQIDGVMGKDFVEIMEDYVEHVNNKVHTTNVIFAHFEPKPEYVRSLRRIKGHYQKVKDLSSYSAYLMINEFVSKQTNQLIPDILPFPLSMYVSSVLMNITYFKDDWLQAFNKKDSEKDVFTNIDGTKKTILFMRGKQKKCQYESTNDYKMCKIPFANGSFIVFIMPKQNFNIPIRTIITKCQSFVNDRNKVDVKIPVMDIEYETLKISDTLKYLGITKIFTGSKTDWEPSIGIKPIDHHITEIRHKVVVKLNEEGVEAAAVTCCIQSNGCGPSDEKEFHCDRPFYYAITDRWTSQILFLGMKTTF